MKLYYFKDEQGNFGDDLNPWLWDSLLPGLLNDVDDHLFVGVGTLLNHRIPVAQRTTVFGSGHGYGQLPNITSSWQFYCVRGPLTAKALGLAPTLAITDPACLVPLFYQPQHSIQYKVSFMPHCDSARLGDWAAVCKLAGMHFIDPRQPYLEVFAEIQRSALLLTEAMHGAILADSFRTPWIPVKAYSHISEYKWQDWLLSVEVDTPFQRLTPVWRGDINCNLLEKMKNQSKRTLVKTPLWRNSWSKAPPKKSHANTLVLAATELLNIAKNAKPNMSKEQVLKINQTKLLEVADRFKYDYKQK
ncbi:polysaccharide pyruvyl transferase family protein [Rheinheimera salexigens]|uniref:Succinoglycan biosynthesis protein exov n=1 Tax=Rheinheimera salexigens TaxID=1628148 RepID=A0A1E7Q776_9GAMM|nr:polysaccharide pyruvyl transferase family protein [Rheinheimera salexigens]OEY69977.1 succinoglycan biosynthesis protein exov [Rheinheimera salexigens]